MSSGMRSSKENVQHTGIEEIESYNGLYFAVKDYAPYDGSGVKLKLVNRKVIGRMPFLPYRSGPALSRRII